MTFATILILAFSMSADAFAASISKGAELQKPSFRHAISIGLIFGTIETITPLLGWLAGVASQRFVQAWDHWAAFSILLVIGYWFTYGVFGPMQRRQNSPRKANTMVIDINGYCYEY